MGKRKDRSENPKTLDLVGEEGPDENTEKDGKGFFACYLLTSLSPRHKGHTYIGFTVNPRRRIRQHNGEIRCGAWRTKSKRPWEMVLCIHGFPTNIAALQFEWAWQHPMESLAVRKAAAAFKSFSGVANKIKLAYTMLNLPTWQSLNITVNYFSTKYTCHCARCPSLPEHMKVHIRSMDELPCYVNQDGCESENEDTFDAESQEEVTEDIIPRIPGIGSLARDSDFANDVQGIDEISKDRNGTTESSLEIGTSISRSKAVGESNMSSFVHNRVAGLKTRRETDFSRCSNLDEDNQGDLIDKLSSFAADATEDQPRPCFRMSGSVQNRAAETKTWKETEFSFCSNLDEDNQDDLIEKQPRDAAAAMKDNPRHCFRMSGSVQNNVAEARTRRETGFSCGLNLGEDNQRDEMEKQSRNAVDATEYGSRRGYEMCNNEVELIDLATPSPSCRLVGLQSKKRRVPDIIDLTRSPSFIQL